MDGNAAKYFKRYCKKPLYLAFEYCVRRMIEWSVDHAAGEPVAVVYSDQNEYFPLTIYMRRIGTTSSGANFLPL